MIVITCIDDNSGMFFHNRRQSKDKKVREKIAELVENKTLWMNDYSYIQFYEYDKKISISVNNDFLKMIKNHEFCFVENDSLKNYENKIEKLILFKWNRIYPADVYLELDLSKLKLEKIEEFSGTSHEKITMEVYTK